MVECICFDYDKFRDVLHEDAIVKVRGKFEASDGRTQIIAYGYRASWCWTNRNWKHREVRPSHLGDSPELAGVRPDATRRA